VTHAGSVAQVEEQIISEGAAIIWVLQQSSGVQPGTAELCRDFMDGRGSDNGYCVGDSESSPITYLFRDAPFSNGRGVDVIVRRSDMRVVFDAGHGTTGGNENLDGNGILAAVSQAVADARALDP
jgi:hypothetical protein